MDLFSNQLTQRAMDTSRPQLANQCAGRKLTDEESALADVLMEIYGTGEHDFSAVAKALTERGVLAPTSGRKDWDEALLASELGAINESLDQAYAENGYGA